MDFARSGTRSPTLPRSNGAPFLPTSFYCPLSSVLTIVSGFSQRFLPKPIHNAEKLRRTMLDARAKKEENRRAHAPKGLAESGALKPKPAKKAMIQRVES